MPSVCTHGLLYYPLTGAYATCYRKADKAHLNCEPERQDLENQRRYRFVLTPARTHGFLKRGPPPRVRKYNNHRHLPLRWDHRNGALTTNLSYHMPLLNLLALRLDLGILSSQGRSHHR